jgi:hypothetical protein
VDGYRLPCLGRFDVLGMGETGGDTMRNPIDFTHKSVYDQMDEDAAYQRRWQFAYKVGSVIAFFIGFIGMLLILKSL